MTLTGYPDAIAHVNQRSSHPEGGRSKDPVSGSLIIKRNQCFKDQPGGQNTKKPCFFAFSKRPGPLKKQESGNLKRQQRNRFGYPFPGDDFLGGQEHYGESDRGDGATACPEEKAFSLCQQVQIDMEQRQQETSAQNREYGRRKPAHERAFLKI